jgi:hypothetical protein
MITRRIFLSGLAGVTAAGWIRLALPQGVGTQNTHDLAEAFLHPPDSAPPWVYWFWINGNVTREGITADLEAMQRVGIGGTLIMEVDPGVPAGDLQFGSQQWMDMFHFAAEEASRLGLEINLYNAAGWDGAAGPWITPEMSMQKVVFSEIDVEGEHRVNQSLPNPERVAGFYRDIAVIASLRRLTTPTAFPISS